MSEEESGLTGVEERDRLWVELAQRDMERHRVWLADVEEARRFREAHLQQYDRIVAALETLAERKGSSMRAVEAAFEKAT